LDAVGCRFVGKHARKLFETPEDSLAAKKPSAKKSIAAQASAKKASGKKTVRAKEVARQQEGFGQESRRCEEVIEQQEGVGREEIHRRQQATLTQTTRRHSAGLHLQRDEFQSHNSQKIESGSRGKQEKKRRLPFDSPAPAGSPLRAPSTSHRFPRAPF
jgi:hypothetical protein